VAQPGAGRQPGLHRHSIRRRDGSDAMISRARLRPTSAGTFARLRRCDSCPAWRSRLISPKDARESQGAEAVGGESPSAVLLVGDVPTGRYCRLKKSNGQVDNLIVANLLQILQKCAPAKHQPSIATSGVHFTIWHAPPQIQRSPERRWHPTGRKATWFVRQSCPRKVARRKSFSSIIPDRAHFGWR
jgi:hypothetical protein